MIPECINLYPCSCNHILPASVVQNITTLGVIHFTLECTTNIVIIIIYIIYLLGQPEKITLHKMHRKSSIYGHNA